VLKVQAKRKLPGFDLDVDFSINQEILAILGSSGSGKTMTLAMYCRSPSSDEGHIELNGRVLFDSAAGVTWRRGCAKGFRIQNYALFPHLTVYENIAYGIHHLSKPEISERITAFWKKWTFRDSASGIPASFHPGSSSGLPWPRTGAWTGVTASGRAFSALDTVRKDGWNWNLMSLQQFYKGNMLL